MSATEPIAAVIKRYREKRHTNESDFAIDDAYTLADAYLRELDDTPITPEGLVADGWRMGNSTLDFTCGNNIWASRVSGEWYMRGNEVHTIGQVRSLVRVFGANA